jgi:predicted TPR repeat methyltransferase
MDFNGELTEAHKQEMIKHGNFSQENIAEHYNELSKHYEEIYLRAGWHDPLKCAELAKHFIGDNAATANVLDMGCGTGLVGQYLKERGFNNIVGIDASAGMIEKARTKNVYSEFHELFLGRPDTFPEHFHGKFDVVTASGILAEGHLDNRVFDEMLLALKTGGYAIFATRTMYLTQYDYVSKMIELTSQSQWKLIEEVTFDRYDKLEEAVGRFSKVEAKAFAFQKLAP